MTTLKWILIVCIVGYLALGAVMYFAQRALMYFPETTRTPPAAAGLPQAEEVTLDTADGERVIVWHVPPRDNKPVVLYFHGNGGNLSNWASILAAVARHGLAVVAFDYRGYGTSTGRPTEQGLYRDVDAVVERLRTLPRRPLPVVYWGRSLGTTMAAYATTVAAPDGVILESGFPDARSVARTSPALALLAVFSSYRFPTADFMRRSVPPPPTLVMHGDRDSVVPIALGRALFTRINEPKTFATIRGGDHNDAAPSDPAYWPQVDHFVAGLRTERRAPSRD